MVGTAPDGGYVICTVQFKDQGLFRAVTKPKLRMATGIGRRRYDATRLNMTLTLSWSKMAVSASLRLCRPIVSMASQFMKLSVQSKSRVPTYPTLYAKNLFSHQLTFVMHRPARTIERLTPTNWMPLTRGRAVRQFQTTSFRCFASAATDDPYKLLGVPRGRTDREYRVRCVNPAKESYSASGCLSQSCKILSSRFASK